MVRDNFKPTLFLNKALNFCRSLKMVDLFFC